MGEMRPGCFDNKPLCVLFAIAVFCPGVVMGCGGADDTHVEKTSPLGSTGSLNTAPPTDRANTAPALTNSALQRPSGVSTSLAQSPPSSAPAPVKIPDGPSPPPVGATVLPGSIEIDVSDWKLELVTFSKQDHETVNKRIRDIWKRVIFGDCVDNHLRKNLGPVSGSADIRLLINNNGKDLSARVTPNENAQIAEPLVRCIQRKLEREEMPAGNKATLEFSVTFRPKTL